MVSTSKENTKHIDQIVFYNHFNNGDIFVSRPYVESIMGIVPVKYSYVQKNHPVLLSDLNLLSTEYTLMNLPHQQRYGVSSCGKILFINTWIGNYLNNPNLADCGCNLKTVHEMYKHISMVLFDLTGHAWDLGDDPSEYYPNVPPHAKRDTIDQFMKDNGDRPLVLFCNGPALSSQARYNGDMKNEIVSLAEKFNHITFITTQEINAGISNVISSSDIIQLNGCDLNEISYLSTFCNTIIGRNSGPFTFSCNKENMMDRGKVLVCFGKKQIDTMEYAIKHNCESIFVNDDIPFNKVFDVFEQQIIKLR